MISKVSVLSPPSQQPAALKLDNKRKIWYLLYIYAALSPLRNNTPIAIKALKHYL